MPVSRPFDPKRLTVILNAYCIVYVYCYIVVSVGEILYLKPAGIMDFIKQFFN